MNINLRKMMAHFLHTLEAELARAGSNDFDLSKFIPDEDARRAFVQAYHDWNGDPHEYDPKRIDTSLPDFAIAGYLAWLIEQSDSLIPTTNTTILNLKKETAGGLEVSDGYHTFSELYDHRNALWIALCKKLGPWRSKKNDQGIEEPGWFILGYDPNLHADPALLTARKQISYHLPIKFWAHTDFALTLEKAPAFDGHSSDDVIRRVLALAK